MFSNCNFYHSLPVPLTNPLKPDTPRWFINMYRSQYMRSTQLGPLFSTEEEAELATDNTVFLKKRTHDNTLSVKWFHGFRRRWPEIKEEGKNRAANYKLSGAGLTLVAVHEPAPDLHTVFSIPKKTAASALDDFLKIPGPSDAAPAPEPFALPSVIGRQESYTHPEIDCALVLSKSTTEEEVLLSLSIDSEAIKDPIENVVSSSTNSEEIRDHVKEVVSSSTDEEVELRPQRPQAPRTRLTNAETGAISEVLSDDIIRSSDTVVCNKPNPREVSNVALGKPATQTDTAGDAKATLAVDGDTTTCSITASATGEWLLDLEDYYLIEEVSILSESI
ncbi:hypothetical protein DPMN_051558 [Dreissena polymorpha]|uniref:Uncharacterized protein n=1 Tax=Dreissena polymorpha TaxID=45954 RepID=A0A9D4HNF4_DREPO|nr:hypothetical protein DPMN_051558 [Dreissena polymorpha]